MEHDIMHEVMDQIRYLPYNLQKQVLNYVKELKKNHEPGSPGQRLLRFAGTISMDDLEIMSDVIEKDCGRIDKNEW